MNLNFLVLIENVLFRSRTLFQKQIYSIFFGTKAGKRKLSILKERWFDIATGYQKQISSTNHKYNFLPIICPETNAETNHYFYNKEKSGVGGLVGGRWAAKLRAMGVYVGGRWVTKLVAHLLATAAPKI